MRSEHTDFPQELLKEVRLQGRLHTDIYLEDRLPSGDELLAYKSSFIIVVQDGKPQAYYVDQTGSVAAAKLADDQALADALLKEKERLATSDFLYLPRNTQTASGEKIEVEDDMLKILAANKSEAKSAFVLHGTNLYYVDKINGKVTALQQRFDASQLEEISHKGIPDEGKAEFSVLNGRQTAALIDLVDAKDKIQPVYKKAPVDQFFSKDSFAAVQTALAPYVPQVENQFYLYQAEVSSSLYPTYRGDFLEEFETIREHKEKSISDSISRTVDKTFDKEHLAEQFEEGVRSAKKKVTSTTWLLGTALKAVSAVFGHGPHDPYERGLSKARDAIGEEYKRSVVEPRAGRAYPLEGSVSIQQMRGGNLEYELKYSNAPDPSKLLKIWIVSEVEPSAIANRGGLSSSLGRSFVCVSEIEARALAKKMRLNKAEFERDMEAKPLEIPAYTDDDNHNAGLKKYLARFEGWLTDQIGAGKALIKRQHEYVADFNRVSEHSISSHIKVEMGKKTEILTKEYTHFAQIEKINEQMTRVLGLIREHQYDKNPELALNKEIKNLYALCKEYIAQHPYKNKDTDAVYNVLNHLEIFKKGTPQPPEPKEITPPAPDEPTHKTPTAR